MVTFEEAAAMLDEAVDALPQEIFNKLNGGVNLLPARRTEENGLLVMGMYFVDQMGRHVEIYYGSFRERYAAAAPERWRRELTRTLKHELTHHIENLAYDRSLERWDAEHVAQLLQGLEDEPLEAESILFVDADGAGLAAIACAMFEQAARDEGCPELRAGFASAGEPVPAPEPKAVKAAAKYGLDISKRTTRAADRAALESYDVALCMTEAQGDALAARWPEFDERIICLGETDITPPRFSTQGGWDRLADRLAEEVRYLLDELLGELHRYAQEGPQLFPDGQTSDKPERQVMGEIIREKLLLCLDKEIPHGTAVEITKFSERESGMVDVDAVIYCEKASHKGIIIGKQGAMLKKVSTLARQDMEKFMGTKVYLETWVKVKENWRDNVNYVRNFGYHDD